MPSRPDQPPPVRLLAARHVPMTDEQRHAAVAAVAALLAYAQHAAPDDGEEAADDGPCEP